MFLKWAWIALSLSRFSKCSANTQQYRNVLKKKKKKYDTETQSLIQFNLVAQGDKQREKASWTGSRPETEQARLGGVTETSVGENTSKTWDIRDNKKNVSRSDLRERDWTCVLQSWLSALEDVSCSLVTSTDCWLCTQHMKEVLKVEPMWKISSSDHEIATCVSSLTLILAPLPSFRAVLT